MNKYLIYYTKPKPRQVIYMVDTVKKWNKKGWSIVWEALEGRRLFSSPPCHFPPSLWKPKKEKKKEETHLQNLTPVYFEYAKINDHKGSNLVFGPTIKKTIYYY